MDRLSVMTALAAAGMLAVFSSRVPAAEPDTQTPRTSYGATVERIDLAEVQRKIAALALTDQTAPYDQQAINWLRVRAQRIVPQLIAGLNDKNPKVAEQCLDLLRNVPARKDLTDALVVKGGDVQSPLRYKALRQLEKSTADPRVVRLLDQSSTEAESFAEPVVRARWAWLAGQRSRAVDILRPLLRKIDTLSFEHVESIRLLGEIGDPAGIELLEPIAAGDRWGLATEAYCAVAKIDPKNHGLTKDQSTLLKDWRGFKESTEQFRQRMVDLAKLNSKEVRPFVMQMLRDKDYSGQYAALLILTAWKDKGALPEIRALMQAKPSYCRQQAVAAYLSIDDARQAQEDVLELLKENDEFSNEAVLRGIAMAAIPTDRKVTMLRAAGYNPKMPYVVPRALSYAAHQGCDVREWLVALMDQETHLLALAGYCEVAAADREKRFAAQVRRAMKLLSSEATAQATDKPVGFEVAEAGPRILDTVAAYDLQDVAPDVEKLRSSKNPSLRNAAQRAGATLGIPAAMNELYAQLHAEDVNIRKLAASALIGIKLVDEKARVAREEALLSCIGKPCEDYAMRVLATCGGERSVKTMESILDDPDAQRAVYAAWVLAQLGDSTAAAKGVRRVAIFGMFYHQVYQQGTGIDFYIAPDLDFHQVTGRLNRDANAYAAGMGPVRIPNDLLVPFVLDDAEQQYAVRCYRLAEVAGNAYSLDVAFLCDPWHDPTMRPQGRAVMNRTHVPLLKEIAAHDSHVEQLMVQGQAVAHFKYRQLAAKEIAAITKETATYLGLAAETLDSEAFPQPYKDQDQLLAKFVVDRVQRARLPSAPQSDRQWQQFELYRVSVAQLRETFGPQVVEAIRREARQRKVDMKNIIDR